MGLFRVAMTEAVEGQMLRGERRPNRNWKTKNNLELIGKNNMNHC